MPSAMLQTTQAIRNACTNDKTDEVNIFILKVEEDVSGSKFFGLHSYCNNKNDCSCLLKTLWDLSLKFCSTFAQRVAPR